MLKQPEWVDLSDEELLKLRICDLGLKLEDSDLADRVQQLHDELAAKGLALRPTTYLGDEWFSPEGVVAIALPFFLAHPRLIQLEQKMMLEVEGATHEWCMRLLRHEAGHCFDHAYGFSKRKDWRKIFGSPDKEYDPDHYHPKPYSRSFVRHIENWYAQSHPDEDFAETFAVWLDPNIDWKKEYAGWPVLKKLEYMDRISAEVAQKKHKIAKGRLPYNSANMKKTLDAYYTQRRKSNATQYPDFYDQDLIRIFGGDLTLSKREFGAARFMTRNRKQIIESVARWSGEKKFTISGLVKKLTDRCAELDLRMGRSEAQTNFEIAAYLATLVTHYLFTGKFKRSV